MTINKLLLLTNSNISYWEETLGEAVSRIHAVLEISKGKHLLEFHLGEFDLIVLDTRNILDLPESITQIKNVEPDAKVIVLSSAPNWKQARLAMLSGAIYYSNKPLDSNQAYFMLRDIILKYFTNGDNHD